MSFRFYNAFITFESLMKQVRDGTPWEAQMTHSAKLAGIFKRLQAAGLKLNPSKWRLFQRHVTFLDHVVSSEGISTDLTPKQVRALFPY